ncbi:PH domain-containing protein [Sulfurimonas sp. SAG-AH-194-I05]|nr:PH domain-containing protein [Sulfurimonas sp. SAG-AH-194-I05]MDF1874503.1 PH domain-containing protein [Sulfurimonas sp. SAG-AH-194-I05]
MSNILIEARPSMMRNSPFTTLIFGTLTLGLVPFIWRGGKVLTIYENGDISYQKGIASREKIELQASEIRSVKVKQSLFARMMNAGNLEIYTTGDSPEVSIAGISNPNEIRETLKKLQND